MKLVNSFTVLGIAALFIACGAPSENKTENTENVGSSPFTYNISPAESKVTWLGEVAGVYGHDGEIKVAEGMVTVQDAQITAGTVTIDMTTIEPANLD